LDVISIGSTMSLRGCIRFGSSLSVYDKLIFSGKDADDKTYISWNPNKARLEVVERNLLGLSIGHNTDANVGGGILHGVWYSDTIVHSSDRRLKRSIRPLAEILNQNAATHGSTDSDGAAWVLRELRPVSYTYRTAAESKLLRFGFIADEMAATLPQVIRDAQPEAQSLLPNDEMPEAGSVKGLVYQDLAAVLVAALQSLQNRLERVHSDASTKHRRIDDVEARLARVEDSVTNGLKNIEDRLGRLEATMGSDRPVEGGLDATQAAIRALLRLLAGEQGSS